MQTIQEKLHTKEAERENAKREVASATDKLMEAQSQLSVAQSELAVVEEERNGLENQVDANREAIEKKKEQFKQRLGVYKNRLKDIYINGQVSYLDVLLGAKDFSDFSSRMYLLKRLTRMTFPLHDELKKKQRSWKRTSSFECSRRRWYGCHRGFLPQQVVARRTYEREVAYTKRVAEQERLTANTKLMATSERITNMIRNLESGGQISADNRGSGSFVWPIYGR